MAGYRFPNCYLRRPSTAVRCRISAGPRLIPQGKTLDGGYKADESGETWTHEGWDTLKFYEVLGFVVKWLIDRLQSRPRVRIHPAPPRSPAGCGISGAKSEIGTCPRLSRDLKDTGELAIPATWGRGR